MLPQRKLYFGIALSSVLLLGFVATSVISYFVAQESLNTRIAEETLPLTSDNIYSEIERDLLRSVLISSLMAHDTFLRDWVQKGERRPVEVLRYLQQIQHKYDTTTAFFVSERTRYYYHPQGVLARIEKDDPQDAWYFRVRAMNDPYEINVDSDTADRQRLTIFVNYRVTGDDGEFVGATGIGLSVRSVAELIEQYQQRYGREIFFVDQRGNVTLNGEGFEGPRRLRERDGIERVATQVLTNPSVATNYRHPDGHTVYLNSRMIPELGWYLVVQQSKSAAEDRILGTLMLNVGIALAIAALVSITGWFTVRGYQSRLEEMASTDKLTGGASRQVFDMIFEQVTRIARRHRTSVSLLAIDIDGFKAINDEHGHAAGDAILRTLGGIFRERLRETDTLCRWGGDEFLVLLSDCESTDAHRIAEDIRVTVAGREIHHGAAVIQVTLSIGVTEYRAGEDLASLTARADKALYESKRAGRNAVSDA
jgi:diguanylate cyclase (GGDEF)-like protein